VAKINEIKEKIAQWTQKQSKSMLAELFNHHLGMDGQLSQK